MTWSLGIGSNQTTQRLYINGNLLATAVTTTSGGLASSLSSLFVGDNRSAVTPSGATLNSLRGHIDELRIYNYDIGPSEIALDRSASHACQPPVDHLEIQGNASGLTCAPDTLPCGPARTRPARCPISGTQRHSCQ